MKRLALLFVMSSFALTLSAQFGVNVRHNWNEAENWMITGDNGQQDIALLEDGFSFGVDYWFRLKNYRVEFLPELNYSQYSTLADPELNFSTRAVSLFLNTNLYLFDLKGDCDCPTFSKEGPTLEKGFFLQISPGVSYFDYQDSQLELLVESSELVFSIAGAVGFDLGISDLITITPMVGLRFYPNNFREDIDKFSVITDSENAQEESSIRQAFAGLRLGIRLDQ